ncbi:MAG TPA: hypothetical protein VHD81_01950 [Mycobacteriales bacterium]|nr:hypothetical protein [Mycobacteriales bacterium]
MSEHFTLDELAELDAGLLARRRAPRHLAECDECSAKAAALRKTQERLRDLGPVQMPADVTARLERVLADADTTAGEDIVPDLGEHRARRVRGVPPWAYAAAAAVVVIGGTAVALGTHHSGSKAADTAAGVPLVPTTTPSTALVLQESGRTYTPGTLRDLAPGLASGASADALSATTPEFAAGAAPQAGIAGGGTSSGQSQSNKTTHGARGQAPASAPPAPTLAAPVAPSIAPSLRRLADSRSALLKCAAFITDTPGASPIAVDFGRWTNAKANLRHVPSVVFVFNDTDDPSTIDVFVVAAACDDSSLLDFEVLSKHG